MIIMVVIWKIDWEREDFGSKGDDLVGKVNLI